MLYITDKTIKEVSALQKGNYNSHEREKILKYLKKFEVSLFTSQPVVDVITGVIVADADNGYTDGKYTWYKSEVYHFEKYRIKLKADFVEHINKAKG